MCVEKNSLFVFRFATKYCVKISHFVFRSHYIWFFGLYYPTFFNYSLHFFFILFVEKKKIVLLHSLSI